ncbi:MAG: M48 family metallopeptidase [candidate division FCPU426 bacterium]
MTGLAWGILAAYLASALTGHGLDFLNRRHVLRTAGDAPALPFGLKEPGLLRKTQAYTVAKQRLAGFGALAEQAAVLLFFYGGLLGWMDGWIHSWRLPFIPSMLLFFLLLFLAQTLLQLPLAWYRQFRLEARFGFNTMSTGLWLADEAKGLLLGFLLLSAIVCAGSWLTVLFPTIWWLWIWGLGVLLSWVLMIAGPLWIAPWFNRFTPLPESRLTDRIKTLLLQAGIRTDRVFSVDASRRSRHTNAYFTGIGRVKRIVLYDTLLESLEEPEVLAVLAHEAGHWKRRHALQRLGSTAAVGLVAAYAAYHVTSGNGLALAFGLETASFAARLALAGLLFQVAFFPLEPLFNAWSRRQELAADRFSAALTGSPDSLGSALVKLLRDNLANWAPHPWYAAFHYSHPPLLQRLAKLAEIKEGNVRQAEKSV